MRIGIFGGTFDPIHLGHLILAERCRDEAALGEVWFLPSYAPPHKTDRSITRFEQRCEMVELAIVGQPGFRVERIEKELPPPSYTAATLAELRERHPQHDFHLILGGDSLQELPTWYEPKLVIERAGIIAVPRPDSTPPTGDQLAEQLGVAGSSIRLQFVDSPLIGLASREIRERVRLKKSIRYLVPRSIEEFIRERKLYAAGA